MSEAKKNPDGILKLTAILFVIAAATALLLGLVNFITADRIEELKAEKTAQALLAVMPEGGEYEFNTVPYTGTNASVAAVYEVLGTDGAQCGYVVETIVSGSQGNIDMVVGLDMNKAITGLSIIEMKETSGMGTKANEVDWRAQFVGADSELAVNKDGGTIDAITGATVTSRAVVNGANIALATVAEMG